MQNLVWKSVLIIAVLALCVFALYPPSQKIRLGKDLQGGTSLVYLVNMPAETVDKAGLLAQTITVLKDRVNPQGVLDISMQPLGVDRIEIVMPLPNDAVKSLRKVYDDKLSALKSSSQITEAQLDEALRFNRAPAEFGASSGIDTGKITALQDSFNALQEARQTLTAARAAATQPAATEPPATTQPEAMFMLEQRVADALDKYEALRAEVLSLNLDAARVVRVVSLSNERKAMKDATGKILLDEKGETQYEPSPRTVAVDALKKQYPQLVNQIDEVLKAHDEYQSKRTTLDDPEDLMRLLRGAGVLQFQIVVKNSSPEGLNIQTMRQQLAELGPGNTESSVARWYPINSTKEWAKEPALESELERDPQTYFANRFDMVAERYNGTIYLLLYTAPGKAMLHDANNRWSVESTNRTQDQLGRAAVSFRLDPSGGNLMSRLTGAHVQQKMAIVLDDQVYTAPNLNSQIGNSGIIEGDFSVDDINYLIRVLAAGSLSARLSDQPIAINTLGPTLGRDNLQRGLMACMWSVVAVAVFMILYYFQAGMIANIAVIANAVMVFGVMAMIDGTFTLPGLAGIALTIGTAVDANILINERIREELERGEDLRSAVRLGYSKAFSTIIDANVTNLIVCVVLVKTATTEVKGFALTLMIGILGTLFTALFMTRVIFNFLIDAGIMKRMPMLATTFPAVHRLLQPNLDWIGLRRVFIPVSMVLVLVSWVLVLSRGNGLFDTEFRGGLAISMRTREEPPQSGKRLALKQLDVEERVQSIGKKAESMPPSPQRDVLMELKNADVVTIGDTQTVDGVLAAEGFQVKVALPPSAPDAASFKDAVVGSLLEVLGHDIDVTEPLRFAGSGNADQTQFTFPVLSPVLGENIKRPEATQNVGPLLGGVAIVIDDLNPPATVADIESRLGKMRDQPDFMNTKGRDQKVFGLEAADPANPAAGFKSVVIVVADPLVNYSKVDFDTWERSLASREWALVNESLSRPPSFEQISEFSSAVASTLRANAIVAVVLSLLGILVYIWIRFGSLRYSTGAIVALVHDVSIAMGALAISQIIGETAFGKALLLESFHIDLNVIAAVLTLIGYSLNDTIVVLDRIRENRGKRMFATAEIVNASINQTFSRTTLTSLTMLISLIILYVYGGTGIRPFAFCMLIGMFVGTYSSIAIAAPLVFKGHDADDRHAELPMVPAAAAA